MYMVHTKPTLITCNKIGINTTFHFTIMNIIVNPSLLLHNEQLQNTIHFLDTKTNNIMLGEFTKLIFTNEDMSLNGLYMHADLHLSATDSKHHDQKQKRTVQFQCNHSQNISIIHDLIQIEHKLLDLYIQYKSCNKRPKILLHPQLANEYIHLYSDISSPTSSKKTIVLKISGIWETDVSYGITYKFIEM
jgi:hypothetical protein